MMELTLCCRRGYGAFSVQHIGDVHIGWAEGEEKGGARQLFPDGMKKLDRDLPRHNSNVDSDGVQLL